MNEGRIHSDLEVMVRLGVLLGMLQNMAHLPKISQASDQLKILMVHGWTLCDIDDDVALKAATDGFLQSTKDYLDQLPIFLRKFREDYLRANN